MKVDEFLRRLEGHTTVVVNNRALQEDVHVLIRTESERCAAACRTIGMRPGTTLLTGFEACEACEGEILCPPADKAAGLNPT